MARRSLTGRVARKGPVSAMGGETRSAVGSGHEYGTRTLSYHEQSFAAREMEMKLHRAHLMQKLAQRVKSRVQLMRVRLANGGENRDVSGIPPISARVQLAPDVVTPQYPGRAPK